jgi:hypothetical protein
VQDLLERVSARGADPGRHESELVSVWR